MAQHPIDTNDRPPPSAQIQQNLCLPVAPFSGNAQGMGNLDQCFGKCSLNMVLVNRDCATVPVDEHRVHGGRPQRLCDQFVDQEIAVLPPANLRTTPRDIAVNGVMAGCLHENMHVLIAAVNIYPGGPGPF